MSISSAHVEMQRMMLRSRERAARRLRVDALVHGVDLLIAEVEEVNLRRHKSVSQSWPRHLLDLVPLLPFAADPGWFRARTTTEALDVLFEIQGRLMRLRSGPLAPDLMAVDEQIEATTSDRSEVRVGKSAHR